MCECHQNCAHYMAVNGTTIPSAEWMDYCGDGLVGGRPDFVPIIVAIVAAPAILTPA